MNSSALPARSYLRTLGLVFVISCASTPVPTQRTETVYGVPGAGALTINPDNAAATSRISAPVDAVWRILPAAFDSVGIPLSLIDPARRQVGSEGFKIRQKLGDARLSRYFECGTTQVGPNADSYELFITVLAQLEPEGTGQTKLTILATAAAKPMQFAQDYSRCSSKSALEKRMSDIVAASVRR